VANNCVWYGCILRHSLNRTVVILDSEVVLVGQSWVLLVPRTLFLARQSAMYVDVALSATSSTHTTCKGCTIVTADVGGSYPYTHYEQTA
jgi:hypothetical protein